MALQKTFDLARSTMVLNGIPLSGFADGDAMTVSMNADLWEKQVGADGEVLRTRVNDRSGRITIRLHYSSLANNALQSLMTLDKRTGKGDCPFLFIDPASGTQVRSPAVWIVKEPDMSIGRAPGPREWVLDGSIIDIVHSGVPGTGGPTL